MQIYNIKSVSLGVAALFWSVTIVGNANEKDSDNDGISDLEESTIYKTDMHLKDTDADGLDDGLELDEYFSDPN